MGVPAVNQPPSILWPAPPALPSGAHVWVTGGSLTPDATCELVAADHVVALVRHAIGAQVERLAPVAVLTADRQYQLRVRSPGRSDIVGVWTVVAPIAAPVVSRCARDADQVALEVSSTAIVHVRAAGGEAIAVITGAGSIAAAPGPVHVRVLSADGALVDDRVL